MQTDERKRAPRPVKQEAPKTAASEGEPSPSILPHTPGRVNGNHDAHGTDIIASERREIARQVIEQEILKCSTERISVFMILNLEDQARADQGIIPPDPGNPYSESLLLKWLAAQKVPRGTRPNIDMLRKRLGADAIRDRLDREVGAALLSWLWDTFDYDKVIKDRT